MLLVLPINVLCALLGGNHRCWGKRGPIISSFITNCVWCSKFALATGLSSEFFSHETCRNGRIAFLLNSSLTPAFTKVFALEVMCQREIVSALLAGRKTSVVAERDREKPDSPLFLHHAKVLLLYSWPAVIFGLYGNFIFNSKFSTHWYWLQLWGLNKANKGFFFLRAKGGLWNQTTWILLFQSLGRYWSFWGIFMCCFFNPVL